MNEVVGSIALIDRRILRAGMDAHFWKLLTNYAHAGNMVRMRMSNKKMLELKLILIDDLQGRRCIPAGIEQRSFARDFIRTLTAARAVLTTRCGARNPQIF